KALKITIIVFCATLFSLPLWADSVLTTIVVGNEPAGIAANPRLNKIYVALDADLKVAVINGETNQVSSTIPLAGHPLAIAVNIFTDRVYSTSCDFATGQCSVYVIDSRTDAIIANIPLPTIQGIGLQGIGVDPVTDRIYVSDGDNSRVYVIDGASNTQISQFSVPSPAGVAVNPKSNRIYVADNGFPGALFVFDGSNNAQIARVPMDSSTEQVATNFRLNRAYTTVDSNELGIVNGANQVVAKVPTGAFPHGVDVNLFNNKIYVANANSASVTIVDGNTNQVVQTLPIPAGFPNGVTVNLVTGRTYITDFSSNTVIVLQE
ncbi:MAG TPA: YncE family protein, partial [Candidatus Angelobacter sp.]|nr:YncE family protein [Candidatus Angelobacter sp.]